MKVDNVERVWNAFNRTVSVVAKAGKLSASLDVWTDSTADRVPLQRGLLLLNSHINLHCFGAPVIDVLFAVNKLRIQVHWAQASSVPTTNNKQVCTTTKSAVSTDSTAT